MRTVIIWLYEAGWLTPGFLMRHPRLVDVMMGHGGKEDEV